MNLVRVLIESARLLQKNPNAFIPHLITTSFYTVYTLLAAHMTLKMYSIINAGAAAEIQELAAAVPEILFLLVFMAFTYVIDMISYAMYPSIVRDHHNGKPARLAHALGEALSVWKVLLALGVLTFTFLLIISAVAGLLNVLSVITSNIIFTAAAVVVMLASVLVFIVLMFFAVPTAVLDKRGVFASFRKSVSLGFEHKYDLLRINIFFLVLVFITLGVAMATEFSGLAGITALAVFIVIRLTQAVVYTYINVVNPYLYVRLKE